MADQGTGIVPIQFVVNTAMDYSYNRPNIAWHAAIASFEISSSAPRPSSGQLWPR